MFVELLTALRQAEQRIMIAWLKGLLLIGLAALFAAMALVWLSAATFYQLETRFTAVQSSLMLAGISFLLCIGVLGLRKLRRHRRRSGEDPLLAALTVLLEPGRNADAQGAQTSHAGDAVILALVFDAILKARDTASK
ncbi:hypothetical protein [Ovoidimarina sediminis]|uniref:hypothetical protein n=1 Tax=Ovoidimarina sediminis TaxID=3079856 RepID=UPI00291345DF|nr:hypothetical protein [Rhodophyticola sp. MJ-SS7]MDU8946463.1 hypothetical protein [Rhodophyticola sp. MJ-SS7]